MFLLKSRVTNHRTQFLRQFSVSRQKCEKQPFVRGAAVNLNTATIGDSAHGKTLLTSNISKIASGEFKPVEDFDKGSATGGSFKATHVWFQRGFLRKNYGLFRFELVRSSTKNIIRF